MELDVIEVNEVGWARGKVGRLWYVQPYTTLSNAQPILPQREGKTPALQLLEATLRAENGFPAPEQAPALIMLPEFTVHPDEAGAAIRLAREARANTVVVFGLGHMNEDQARALEPGANLWNGPSEGRFTNCAVVVFCGSGRVFLQPKIIRSRWEEHDHWPGRVVRYFVARNFQFIVLICSELLDRPDGATTARAIVEHLEERGRQLSFVIWIQHNPRPRSPEFSGSTEEFLRLRSTTVVVSSRVERSPNRLNNYAVSGAFVPHDALPNHFDLLTKRFHYVEPVTGEAHQSRVVLLRYDADVYRVETALARWVDPNDRTAKGALFEESQPYVLGGGVLVPSAANFHIEDVCARAVRLACELMPGLADRVRRIAAQLVAATTAEFMSVLDVGILPRPRVDTERHVAGVKHAGGDYRCRCWRHRECVDYVADQDESAEPVAHILTAMAALDAAGIETLIRYDPARRTNLVLSWGGTQLALGLVFPFNSDADGTEEGLWGRKRAPLVDSAYIVLGVGERAMRPPMRPRVESVDAALARPIGAIHAGTSAPPVLRALYSNEFWAAADEDRLREALEERFIRRR